MAKRVGLITINLLAGTADFNTQMESAKAKIRSLGNEVTSAQHKLVSGNQAASGVIRVFEGGMTNNLRAVENFLTRTLGLGPIMQAIFPIAGAIAFGGLVIALGTKVYDIFKKGEEGAVRVTNAFRSLNQSVKTSSDELQLSNDRLLNDIAKLEGRRQNNLKIALDEVVVSADKLADSLERDISGLNKLLEKEELGRFKAFFLGQASTSGIRQSLFGKSGLDSSSGFEGPLGHDVPEVTQAAEDKLEAITRRFDAAKTQAEKIALLEEANVVRAKARTDLEKIFTTQIEASNERLRQAKILAQPTVRIVKGKGDFAGSDFPIDVPGQDERLNIATEEGVNRQLRNMQTSVARQYANVDLLKKKGDAEAANAAQRLSRPLNEKLASLDASVEESKLRLDAAGASEEMKELAKANEAAVKAIQEVNKALIQLHEGPMSKASEDAIHLRENTIAANNAETAWRDRLAITTAALDDRIASQKRLTAAVGEGYDATRKASIAYQVMTEVGHERFNDPKWMADPEHKKHVTGIETRVTAEQDEKHATQVATTIDKLEDHIELEKKLALVQVEGAEAVRKATLALTIERIARDNDVESGKKLIQAEKDLYAAERANVNATALSQINLEIAATRRLAAAQIEGAETYRRTQLELKYETMRRQGSTPANIDATRQEDELKHQQAVTEEVLKTANADRNRLEEIRREAKAAALLLGTEADQLGVMIKLRDLENERLKIISQQYLAFGGLKDGVRSFFVEMQESAKTSASIVKEALDSAFNDVSNNLAKLVTHQKTSFGAMFKSIGTQMVESTIKQQLQKGLGALGKAIGIKLPGAPRQDGQTAQGAIYVQEAPGTGTTPPSGKPGGVPGLGPIFGGSQGGGIFNLFGKGLSLLGPLLSGLLGGASGGLTPSVSSSISFGGMLAGGGDVSADKAYIVGDDGPEILRRTSGAVMSNSASKKLLGGAGGNTYHVAVDARGADENVIYQRVAAGVLAAHNSAVGTSVQATIERARRVPSGAA